MEHEYIIIMRKKYKRVFEADQEKKIRRESSFFWEERNAWFSDIWDFKGVPQTLKRSDARDRSAAYPFDLAYRLINMYSLYQDTVLDPFLGTGTTALASLACGRNSIGVEIEDSFSKSFVEQATTFQAIGNRLTFQRIARHNQFVKQRRAQNGPLKYTNTPHGFPVMTRQEIDLELHRVSKIHVDAASTIRASYELMPAIESPPSHHHPKPALPPPKGIPLKPL